MPVFPSSVFLHRRGTRWQDAEPAAGVGLGEQTHGGWLTQERGQVGQDGGPKGLHPGLCITLCLTGARAEQGGGCRGLSPPTPAFPWGKDPPEVTYPFGPSAQNWAVPGR